MSDFHPSILITGANGFIGSYLIKAFDSRYRVIGVSHESRVSSINHLNLAQLLDDTEGRSALSGSSPELLIHCAGLAHRSPPRSVKELKHLYQVNVNLTLRLAAWSKRVGIKRFVFISTIGVHGSKTSGSTAISESSPVSPVTHYGRSKTLAENKLRECLDASTCNLSIIRPALVYGRGMPGNLRALVRAIDAEIPFPLSRVVNQRSFVALPNLVSAIETVAIHSEGADETFVVADEETISTPDLICAIAAIRQRQCRLFPVPSRVMSAAPHLPIVGGKIGQLVDDMVVDSRKIRQLLGWRQPFTQAEAMAEAFALPSSSLT